MQIAARSGLAGLTIGRLARDLTMSKSGLFAHFRSKRSLEMATINEARNLFVSQVLSPARATGEGIAQVWVLCDSWLAHIERRVFAGGYFFTGAFFECAERSGPVEKEINGMTQEWWGSLRDAVRKAKDRKEIVPTIDLRRLCCDLNGTLISAYWTYLVEKNDEVLDEARIAILAKLKGSATDRIRASAFESEKAWKDYLKRKRAEIDNNGEGRRPEAKQGSSRTPPPASSRSRRPSKRSLLRKLGRLVKR
jgi:AcrR family transcriptional regulator